MSIKTSKELKEKEDYYSVFAAFMYRLANLDDTNKECFEHIIQLSYLLPKKIKKSLKSWRIFAKKNLISTN